MDYQDELHEFFDAMLQKTIDSGEIVEIDGELLVYERVPPAPREKPKIFTPLDMRVDLSKIDITNEMRYIIAHDELMQETIAKTKAEINELFKHINYD